MNTCDETTTRKVCLGIDCSLPTRLTSSFHWWLVRVTLVVDWLFCLEILVWWWGPTKAFCPSVNVHGVEVLFAGGGDSSTLHVITELFALRGSRERKTSSNCMRARLRAQGMRPCALTLGV